MASEQAQLYTKILGTLDKVAIEIAGFPKDQQAAAFALARENYKAVLNDHGADTESSAARYKIDTIILRLRKTVAAIESRGRPIGRRKVRRSVLTLGR